MQQVKPLPTTLECKLGSRLLDQEQWQEMAQVLEALLPTQESWVGFLAPDPGLIKE